LFFFVIGLVVGLFFCLFVLAIGAGMQRMGPLGASVGFGVYQSLQLMASQTVGFASGEWRGVAQRPRMQMACSLALLMASVVLRTSPTMPDRLSFMSFRANSNCPVSSVDFTSMRCVRSP